MIRHLSPMTRTDKFSLFCIFTSPSVNFQKDQNVTMESFPREFWRLLRLPFHNVKDIKCFFIYTEVHD